MIADTAVIDLAEPQPQVVWRARAYTTGDNIVILGDSSIRIPSYEPKPTPELRRLLWELQARTGWSARHIARVLGTSHTTINRVDAGSRPRRAQLRQRFGSAHEVASRVHVLVGGDAEATARVLETPGSSGRTPVDLLRADEPARALLVALEILNPRRDGLLVGAHSRTGDATAPLHD